MINIKIEARSNGTSFMFQNAETKAQRALLGYMVKSGLATDPILGGAFNVLCKIEECERNNVIYIFSLCCEHEVATEIATIAEKAKLGEYNKYAFSKRELSKILCQLNA